MADGQPNLAQEYQPYATPRITPEQFAKYAEEVRLKREATAEIFNVERRNQ